MSQSEWLDAQQALQILGIHEDELFLLVAAGSLRAFRSDGTMKFRHEDIAARREQMDTVPTIIPATQPQKGKSGILIPLRQEDLFATVVEPTASVAATVPTLTGTPTVAKSRAPGSRVIGVSMASSRRVAPVYQRRPAHPFTTAMLLVNAAVLMFAGSVNVVLSTLGHYDRASGQRIIPAYLNHTSSTPVYRWCYHETAGDPQDKKPAGEYDGGEHFE